MQAYLILANGRVFRGVSVGCPGTTIGEVVFATGMVGFEETLTDPSYYGQIITQTYPLIGNYGMNSEDVESTKIWARGYIVREACKTPSNFRSEETLDAFLKKNGIIRMSREIDKLVETSLNLGVLKSDDDAVTLRYAVRSSVGVAKKSLKNQLVCIAGAFAAEVTFEGDYPAWEYKKDSKLREDMVRIFEEMYGKKPTVEAIHAGVECGLLSGKIEGLDCISMGPDMYDIHTTEERLSISSAKRSYEYILRVIACK